ncbi:MAG: hypothetical protein ACRCWM_08080 [Sarcina sp.]
MSVIRIKNSDGSISNVSIIKGKSAYEIAVLHGFVGTEEQWINSMQRSKDDNLQTTSKRVTGAINELNAKVKDMSNKFTQETTTTEIILKYDGVVILTIPLPTNVL